MAARYPDWVVQWGRIAPIPEVLCIRRHVVLVDRGVDRATRRCALAHAVAHIDLGHHPATDRQGRRYELDADQLAASRLIPVHRLADALAWALCPDEVAVELGVTTHMAQVRVRGLTLADKAYVQAVIDRADRVA